ncbi:MAG: FecR domain-containing protein [Sandaracinaceae bacterium]|nr:FecR domain-containing protein [Sandaracinaceae bacterium]
MRRGAAWLALALVACGQEAPTATPPPPREVEDEPSEGHAATEDPAPASLVRASGEVTVGGAEARVGADLAAEVPIEVPEGGQAVIQLRDGGRLELDGPARAVLVEDSAAQVMLLRGRLYAAQPPAGNAPRPPLRIAAPSSTVEIGHAGEVYVAVFDWGGSWVSVLQGGAAVSVGESDARQRLRELDVVAGRAVAAPDRLAEPTEGPTRLAAAREAAAALAALEAPAVEPAAERAALAQEADRLDQALRSLETETRRGRDLTSQHRDAVRQGQTDEASRLQRELVAHSQALYRLRRLATARWERVRAKHLRLDALGRAPSEDPVQARRDRVEGLLGR